MNKEKYSYIDRVLLFAVVQSLECGNAAELWRLINAQKETKPKILRLREKSFKR